MQEQQNQAIHEPVVELGVFDIKIKDEDPLSIAHGDVEPVLKNINQGAITSIKQELPEIPTAPVIQQSNLRTYNGPGLVLTPVPLVTPNATTTSNTSRNTNNISNRNITSHRDRSLVESTLKTFEIQSYQNKLLKCQKVLKKKNSQVKCLSTQNRRLKDKNEKLKQLLKKYKQKQVISESVLNDIAKNSKIANMLISSIMSDDN